jgi:hypothetical protein
VPDSNNSLEKENRDPEVAARMRETALSTCPSAAGRPGASQRSLPGSRPGQRRVAVEGLGEAVLLPHGNVRVYYTDGSSLILRDSATAVDFFTPCLGGGGAWATYDKALLPPAVLARMAGMPRVLELLLGEGDRPARPASVR